MLFSERFVPLFKTWTMTALVLQSSVGLSVDAGPACRIDPYREMVIVNPFVIENAPRVLPKGPWHFSTLIRQMLPANATDQDFSRFTINWLQQWEKVRLVNTFPVTQRTSVRNAILCPWLNASNNRTDCTGTVLKPELAPFRLLAIVNRMDKYQRGSEEGGEGRFVFGALSRPTNNPLDVTNAPLNFTLIFEYQLTLAANRTVNQWAEQWHVLGDDRLPCKDNDGCEAYRARLESITRSFSQRNINARKPNGNPLNQMRSNEFLYGSSTWELREFKLGGSGKNATLTQVPVQQTPDPSLNNSSKLERLIVSNQKAIMDGTYSIPKEYLGGAVSQSLEKEFKWAFSSRVPEALRFNFSKMTCNGCHREEREKLPAIDAFFHISPHRLPGIDRVSPYLQTIAIPERAKLFAALACPDRAPELSRGLPKVATGIVH